jgi:hypothetical protein
MRLKIVPELWENRDSPQTFNRSELLRLNKLIGVWHETCMNRSHNLPSSYTNSTNIQRICQVKGDGNKTIVVFGNSHSFMSFIGLTHFFKPIAKSITLIATPVCTPSLVNKNLNKRKPNTQRC